MNTHRKSFPLQRTQQHRYRDKISSLGPRLLIPKMCNSAGYIENSYGCIHRTRVICVQKHGSTFTAVNNLIETLVVPLGSPLERLRETIHICNNQSLIEETEYTPTKYTPTTAVQERPRRPSLNNNLISMYSTTSYVVYPIILRILPLHILYNRPRNPTNANTPMYKPLQCVWGATHSSH